MAGTESPASAYPADLYAAVHRGNAGDVDFYRRVSSGARSVLELGLQCYFLFMQLRPLSFESLSADGVEVVGLEQDPELAARARASGLEVHEADMRRFDLGRTFDRVILPYNGIYCLLSEEDVISCLRSACAHLTDEGLLVFDAYAADDFHVQVGAPDEDELGLVTTAEVAGRRFSVYEQTRFDPHARRLDARYVHVPDDGGAPIEAVIAQRYLLSQEVEPLLERAGLRLIALLGGFDQAAFDPEESETLIAVACRQGSAVSDVSRASSS